MLRALQDSGLAGKVIFVGFDASPKLTQALAKGQIHGLVLQNPVNMGYLGVKTMATYLKNKELPKSRRKPVKKVIDTGEMLATMENMNEAKVKDILEPNLKEWLK
jgi:ribose transport system substrate-binding protein